MAVVYTLMESAAAVGTNRLVKAALSVLVLYAILRLGTRYLAGRQRRAALLSECDGKCERLVARCPTNPLMLGYDFVAANVAASLKRCYLDHSSERFDKYGPTWAVSTCGSHMIQTIDPENLKAVFATRFHDWELGNLRTETFRPLLGNGIFTLNGGEWSHSRSLLRTAFKKSQTLDVTMYEPHIQKLYELLPKDGVTVVDIQGYFFQLAMDTATEIFFGKSVHSLGGDKDSEAGKFGSAYETAKLEVFTNLQLYPLSQYKGQKKLKEAVRTVHDYVNEFVDLAFASRDDGSDEKGVPYNFLRDIAKETDDRGRVRSELLSLLLAARDTTAALLSNTFLVLSKRADIAERARAEIAWLDGKQPTFAEVKSLKYIEWLLKESLRLHSVVPVNTRTAVRDTILPTGGGTSGKAPILVSKGTQVVTNLYALHRRPDIYGPDASEFKPERWETLRPGWGFIPFLGGPRICPGQSLAMTEAAYTIIRLLQLFSKIESASDADWKEDLAITCSNFNGTKVRLTSAVAASATL